MGIWSLAAYTESARRPGSLATARCADRPRVVCWRRRCGRRLQTHLHQAVHYFLPYPNTELSLGSAPPSPDPLPAARQRLHAVAAERRQAPIPGFLLSYLVPTHSMQRSQCRDLERKFHMGCLASSPLATCWALARGLRRQRTIPKSRSCTLSYGASNGNRGVGCRCNG